MARAIIQVDEALIRRAVLSELAAALSRALAASVGAIRRRVGQAAGSALRASPAWASLLTGPLRHELGVVAPGPVLERVAANLENGVAVTSLGATAVGDRIEGGLRVELLKGDYSEVLGAPGASFPTRKGQDIPWLRWLTLEGDRVLVAEHWYLAAQTPGSRTGLGIMVPRGRSSRTWSVPAEYRGNVDDNWITRALRGIDETIAVVVAEEIGRNL